MELNKEQLEIVNANDDNIVVIAGAGSGKTTVMMERIKRLLKDGVNPQEIVAITFTNLAADVLRQRLKDVEGGDKCFIGTIHGYANHILKKSNIPVEIYSDYHEQQYMQQLINQYGKYTTLEQYYQYKKDVVRLPYYELDKIYSINQQKEFNMLSGTIPNNYDLYPYTVDDLCKINNVISFNQLLEMSSNYYKQHKLKLNYLFVDEFQDVGLLEFDFLLSLNSSHNFVIGDDYQSIYKFKGSDFKLFLKLVESENWKTYYLKNNYRNSQLIYDYSNSVISQCFECMKKQTLNMNKSLGKIMFQSKPMLVDILKSINPNKYKDWFILTRSNSELDIISKIMKSHNIPYKIISQRNSSVDKMTNDLNENNIKLMTAHASKGLESSNVIMYGNFTLNSKSNSKQEELRLSYVAVTRAIDNLIIFI